MRRLSIGSMVAILLCVVVFARGQEKTNFSQDSQPLFKQCSDKNPSPCADKLPTVTFAPDPECSREADKAKTVGTVVLKVVIRGEFRGLVQQAVP
jgi:hypothetical protein